MKILSIDIKNFRLHADTVINFETTGITGIVGSNESGKSTILEALVWAFFGGDTTRGTKQGLRWKRAVARHVASVTVRFELKGQEYFLSRTEGTAKLHTMPKIEVLAEGTAAVNLYIPTLLGLSHNEFAASFMVKQKDVERIANMLPTERTTFVREVLGVGKLDEALKKCRKRKNEIGQELEGMRAGLGEREPLEKALTLAQGAIGGAGVAQDRAAEALKAATAAKTEAATACDRLMGMKAEDDVFRLELHQSEVDIDRLAKSRVKLQNDLGDMARLKEELAAATDEYEPLSVLRDRRQELSTLAGDAGKRAHATGMTRDTERKGHLADLAGLNTEVVELDALIEGIKGLGMEAGCPTCTVPLGDNYQRVLGDLEAQRSALRATQDGHITEIKMLEAPTEEEVADGAANARYLADLHDLDLLIQKAQARDTELAEIRGKVANEEAMLRDLAAEDDMLQEATGQLNEAEEARSALGFDNDAFRASQKAAGDANEAHQQAQIAEAKADAAVEAADARIVSDEEALKRYDFRAEALQDVEAFHMTHEKASVRLADFRASVAATIRPELEELMSGFIHLLTDGRHEAVELTEDFEAVLFESGIAMEVVSGGCEDVAALAMRLSISQMIAERAGHPLSLLILDEPFGSQDENRRANILTLLRTLKGVFEQVIVISHIAETRDAADHIIELEFDEVEGRARVIN